MKRLSRRTVYAGTIVTMLLLASGFALASTGFIPFSTTSVKGNQGAISTSGTIYDPGVLNSLFTTGSSSCPANPSASGGASATVIAWVAGGPSACGGFNDYVLQITFESNSSIPSGTYVDTFIVSSEFSSTSFTTSSVTVSCGLTLAGQCFAQINIDTGTLTTSSQPTVNAVDITVTGD